MANVSTVSIDNVENMSFFFSNSMLIDELDFKAEKNLINPYENNQIAENANKKSEIMKGEGDGERNKIFANAFGRDPSFFSFYRAMQAYEKALIGGETSLVLSPDSEFFKFFGKSSGPAIRKK